MKTKAYGISLYKVDKNNIKILLCKSITSKSRWGFLKGVQEKGESDFQTAIREFREESSINIEKKYLQKYFEQKNTLKDIGIYLVNYNNIQGIQKYFNNEVLLSKYLSWENSEVKFFDITNLPNIKKKQNSLIQDVIKYLQKG
jgi:8-oxo-dGTP pyrophosphatase MutT (NUDIX family)